MSKDPVGNFLACTTRATYEGEAIQEIAIDEVLDMSQITVFEGSGYQIINKSKL